MEDQLRQHAENEKVRILRSSVGVDLDLALQEHSMTFDMMLPNFYRYSLIVLLRLVIEEKLRELSSVLKL